jgi:hypothetical protein
MGHPLKSYVGMQQTTKENLLVYSRGLNPEK